LVDGLILQKCPKLKDQHLCRKYNWTSIHCPRLFLPLINSTHIRPQGLTDSVFSRKQWGRCLIVFLGLVSVACSSYLHANLLIYIIHTYSSYIYSQNLKNIPPDKILWFHRKGMEYIMKSVLDLWACEVILLSVLESQRDFVDWIANAYLILFKHYADMHSSVCLRAHSAFSSPKLFSFWGDHKQARLCSRNSTDWHQTDWGLFGYWLCLAPGLWFWACCRILT
jgi:hypothetical protein